MKYLNDISCKDCVGKVCKSKSSGDFKIVKYNDARNVEIQFVNTWFETSVQLTNLRNGNVKDRLTPSVYGVGELGTKYQTKVNGVKTKEYTLWCNVLWRCYSDGFKKKQPTYEGCEVSDKFKSYEYFYEWCHKQVGFNNEGWHLDKDLLVKGNKDGDIIKVKKEWNDDILTDGGVSYYKLNDKWYRVSVCDGDNDIVLKFTIKDAMNRLARVS